MRERDKNLSKHCSWWISERAKDRELPYVLEIKSGTIEAALFLTKEELIEFRDAINYVIGEE